MDGADFDLEKGEALVQPGQVFHVARQPVERLDQYDLEPAVARSVE
nr:hypothetical protein [Roseivivax lentus]